PGRMCPRGRGQRPVIGPVGNNHSAPARISLGRPPTTSPDGSSRCKISWVNPKPGAWLRPSGGLFLPEDPFASDDAIWKRRWPAFWLGPSSDSLAGGVFHFFPSICANFEIQLQSLG